MNADRPHARALTIAAPTGLIRADARAELERSLSTLLPVVRGLLFRMLGPRPDLDDAVQDTLLALATALPSFEGRSSLQTFARTIAVRVAYRYFKVEQHLDLDPACHAHEGKQADEMLAEQRSLSRLHRCLSKLPGKRRVAFVLCAIEGLTPQEAAELCGTSAGSMRARFMHARQELQRMLSAEERDSHG